ncbi:MAG: DNA (cytosine-5-)-methyltransferase [Betaproteobacteria bacterium RBG_16_58_11]|nr:MAG: DNA (cytosine-5-)-methyltransferase [Betaproteobacteria bacterium RBG_16_58_11]OFZ96671.1 MAG: DNA (cytosine-5-)-methyltransferase [Betaproteobacteria bacterium RBG_19FT_COMBO_58_11]
MKTPLLPLARSLRSNQTDAERLLWRHLRAGRLEGHKFKRQQPLGPYIADFVCFKAMLVVELDGGQHADQVNEDAERTRWLTSQGYRVLRFWNNELIENMEGVWAVISAALSPSPQPSPLKGEGANGG